MKLNEQVEAIIGEIYAGITQFNDENDTVTAFMPEEIEFDMHVDPDHRAVFTVAIDNNEEEDSTFNPFPIGSKEE